MTEYFRQQNNKIQAGFALHIGKLLVQYRNLAAPLPSTQKYEATMTICALQALLTNCTELMKSMKSHQRGFWHDTITDIPDHWGIRRSFVVKNTLYDEPTYYHFITHLRNALSHPTSPDHKPHYPTTGYTTVPDESGEVTRFNFIDSSWIDRGKIYGSYEPSPDKEKVELLLRNHQKKFSGLDDLVVSELSNGKYQIHSGNQIYLPVFQVELPLPALTNLAIEMANHLSQPVLDDWDGKTIHQLVA